MPKGAFDQKAARCLVHGVPIAGDPCNVESFTLLQRVWKAARMLCQGHPVNRQGCWKILWAPGVAPSVTSVSRPNGMHKSVLVSAWPLDPFGFQAPRWCLGRHSVWHTLLTVLTSLLRTRKLGSTQFATSRLHLFCTWFRQPEESCCRSRYPLRYTPAWR